MTLFYTHGYTMDNTAGEAATLAGVAVMDMAPTRCVGSKDRTAAVEVEAAVAVEEVFVVLILHFDATEHHDIEVLGHVFRIENLGWTGRTRIVSRRSGQLLVEGHPPL